MPPLIAAKLARVARSNNEIKTLKHKTRKQLFSVLEPSSLEDWDGVTMQRTEHPLPSRSSQSEKERVGKSSLSVGPRFLILSLSFNYVPSNLEGDGRRSDWSVQVASFTGKGVEVQVPPSLGEMVHATGVHLISTMMQGFRNHPLHHNQSSHSSRPRVPSHIGLGGSYIDCHLGRQREDVTLRIVQDK